MAVYRASCSQGVPASAVGPKLVGPVADKQTHLGSELKFGTSRLLFSILKRLFSFGNAIPTLESKLWNLWGQ